jgi:hypothetical protein
MRPESRKVSVGRAFERAGGSDFTSIYRIFRIRPTKKNSLARQMRAFNTLTAFIAETQSALRTQRRKYLPFLAADLRRWAQIKKTGRPQLPHFARQGADFLRGPTLPGISWDSTPLLLRSTLHYLISPYYSSVGQASLATPRRLIPYFLPPGGG